MKREYVFLCWCMMVVAASAMPQENKQKLGGYYVLLDNAQRTATLLDADYARPGKVYEQTELLVPVAVTLTGPSMGGDPVAIDYVITALGTRAFYNAPNATAVTFAADSRVSRIETEALAQMPNLSQDTLTLPASLDSLALSAVVLPGIKYIEFLGAVPPRCAVATQGDAVNPWTSATEVTMPSVQVLVPEGAWSAYKAAAGIGDYFTCFQGETPTGVTEQEHAPVRAYKVMQNGQLVIIHNGVVYDAQGREFYYKNLHK